MSSCRAACSTELSRLQQHEIAYLNICSWFYPQYLELTKYLETLDLAITYNGQKYPIKSWGLYHSLIGDLNTKSKRFSGGHCNYQNMLSHLFNLEETEVYAQQFKKVKLINKTKEKIYKTNTIFPNSWSPTKCVEAIVDAIRNPKNIELNKSNRSEYTNSFIITSQKNIQFNLCINKVTSSATFFPKK